MKRVFSGILLACVCATSPTTVLADDDADFDFDFGGEGQSALKDIPLTSSSPLFELLRDADAAHRVAVEKAAELAREQLTRIEKELTAAAQQSGYSVVRKSTAVDFGDDTIEGNLTKPDGSYLEPRKSTGGRSAPTSLEGMLLEGVLKFVERRAREEAVRYVVKRLSQQLCGGENRSAAVLPRTCGLLATVGRIPEMMAPLELLHQSVRSDLHTLPRRLAERSDLLATAPGLVCGLRIGSASGDEMARGDSADQILHATLASLLKSPCREALKTPEEDLERRAEQIRASALLVALATLTAESSIATGDSITALAARTAPSKVEVADEVFLKLKTARDRIDVILVDSLAPAALIARSRELAATVDKALKDLEAARAVARAAFDVRRDEVIAELRPLCDAVGGPMAKLRWAIKSARERVEAGGERKGVEEALDHGSVAAASVAEALIAILAAEPADAQAIALAVDGASRFHRGSFTGGMASLMSSGLLPAEDEPYRTLVAFSELLSGLASATSSEEVAALIESAAPPSGSWERKRRRVTVGLSAQFGAAAGLGWVQHAGETMRAAEVGAYIPIGVDMSAPVEAVGSIGFMVQVLDIGAVSSTQLGDDDQIQAGANAELTSVFSPGALVYLGIGDTPLVVALAANYVPDLRVAADEQTVSDFRVQVGVGIDVPLFMF